MSAGLGPEERSINIAPVYYCRGELDPDGQHKSEYQGILGLNESSRDAKPSVGDNFILHKRYSFPKNVMHFSHL